MSQNYFLLLYRLSSVDIGHIQGNLEEISTFQQMLVQSLDEQTKSVCFCLCKIPSFFVGFKTAKKNT